VKRSQHREWAAQIGDASHHLIHYAQLPDGASDEEQIQALDADARWQQNNHDETQRAIESLKQDIWRCNYETANVKAK